MLGLGANLGDPHAQLAAAVDQLRAAPGIAAVRCSSVYATRPIGPPQPDYLNMAVLVGTTLEPAALLAACQAAEQAGGRVRAARFGPRTIDVDVLWWEGRSLALPELVVPHPRLVERRFALEPLLELVPDAALPDGRPLAAICAALPDQGVRRALPGEASTIC